MSSIKTFKKWSLDGAEKKDAKNYQNVTHPPLLTADSDMLILDLIVPPELHLMLGNLQCLNIHNFVLYSKHNVLLGITQKLLSELKSNCFCDKTSAEMFMTGFFKKVHMFLIKILR